MHLVTKGGGRDCAPTNLGAARRNGAGARWPVRSALSSRRQPSQTQPPSCHVTNVDATSLAAGQTATVSFTISGASGLKTNISATASGSRLRCHHQARKQHLPQSDTCLPGHSASASPASYRSPSPATRWARPPVEWSRSRRSTTGETHGPDPDHRARQPRPRRRPRRRTTVPKVTGTVKDSATGAADRGRRTSPLQDAASNTVHHQARTRPAASRSPRPTQADRPRHRSRSGHEGRLHRRPEGPDHDGGPAGHHDFVMIAPAAASASAAVVDPNASAAPPTRHRGGATAPMPPRRQPATGPRCCSIIGGVVLALAGIGTIIALVLRRRGDDDDEDEDDARSGARGAPTKPPAAPGPRTPGSRADRGGAGIPATTGPQLDCQRPPVDEYPDPYAATGDHAHGRVADRAQGGQYGAHGPPRPPAGTARLRPRAATARDQRRVRRYPSPRYGAARPAAAATARAAVRPPDHVPRRLTGRPPRPTSTAVPPAAATGRSASTPRTRPATARRPPRRYARADHLRRPARRGTPARPSAAGTSSRPSRSTARVTDEAPAYPARYDEPTSYGGQRGGRDRARPSAAGTSQPPAPQYRRRLRRGVRPARRVPTPATGARRI